MSKYKVLSLFSGCDGLDLGFRGDFRFLNKQYRKNDFKVIWANDADKHACRTYENYFDHPIICGDIRDMVSGKKTGLFDAPLPVSTDIVLGGFPCQDFSHAGKRRGFKNKRGTLYQAMSDVIKKQTRCCFWRKTSKGF